MPGIVLLGPQRFKTMVTQAVHDLRMEGKLAVITAGWQEREAEVEELDAHLGSKSINLLLHKRGEQIFRNDTTFREAHRNHQECLKRLQELYRLRLELQMDAIHELLNHSSRRRDLIEPEVEDAIEGVRRLDSHHLNRLREVNQAFEEKWLPLHRSDILAHRHELEEILAESSGLLIAGGHVAVILNRIRLFKLDELIRKKPVVAWSAGAMVLGQRVVLFHDNPPQGKGISEIFENGLGLYNDLIPFPHARNRLDLDDKERVSMLARRFQGSTCVALDPGSRVTRKSNQWLGGPNTFFMNTNGELQPMEVSA